MGVQLVQCEILDKEWKRRQSGGVISLEINKAQRLQQTGKVRILNQKPDCKKKTMISYDNKALIASDGDYMNKSMFSLKKKVKIGWVQDFSKVGGAELSNKHLANIGNDLGYDIIGITPVNFNKQVLYNSDLLIINNFFEFPIEKFNTVMDAIYEKRIPYIKYDHDHREMHRPYFSRQLFTMSKLNVFISPLHKEKTINLLGSHIDDHSICLPLSIDTKEYIDIKEMNRIKNSVIVPCYRKCKDNIVKFIKENKDKSYLIIGDIDFSLGTNFKITISKLVDANKMPELFNEYESMVHLPISFWAGERIYFESILCGCTPIVNDNVGHKSWNFNNGKLKDNLDKAPFTFWKEVEKCCKI